MSEQTKSAAELAAETKAAFDKSIDAVKALAEEAKSEAAKGRDLSASTKEKADEALMTMNGLKARLDEMEQKADRMGGGDTEARSIGDRFTESDEFKHFQANQRQGSAASVSMKADLTTSTGVAGGMGAAVHSTHIPGIQALPQRRMTIRNLLMPGRTDGPMLDYDRETGFTNNAGMAEEGSLKQQSDISIEEVSTRTKVIAHWFRVSKQTLSDVAQIRSIIDNRLLYGLAMKEEQQLLFGDGTGENLLGIIPQATAYAAPTGATAPTTTIDKLRVAMLQAVLAEYPASATVLNPIDWTNIELTKDTAGWYLIANPQGSTAKSLWNLPVVDTPAMTVGKFLTGAFDMGAQIFDQWAARIETGFQNDDFTRNKVTVLGEERLALAVYRPESFIYGDTAIAAG
ncbi:phage major capsid protein [Thioclava kandeliae]|uniref:Phage major capsid protein n=1 Tax=Thioclava kandeliae TaxID=3070818 RepID=A0ABV1SFB6_9RHOB